MADVYGGHLLTRGNMGLNHDGNTLLKEGVDLVGVQASTDSGNVYSWDVQSGHKYLRVTYTAAGRTLAVQLSNDRIRWVTYATQAVGAPFGNWLTVLANPVE